VGEPSRREEWTDPACIDQLVWVILPLAAEREIETDGLIRPVDICLPESGGHVERSGVDTLFLFRQPWP